MRVDRTSELRDLLFRAATRVQLEHALGGDLVKLLEGAELLEDDRGRGIGYPPGIAQPRGRAFAREPQPERRSERRGIAVRKPRSTITMRDGEHAM